MPLLCQKCQQFYATPPPAHKPQVSSVDLAASWWCRSGSPALLVLLWRNNNLTISKNCSKLQRCQSCSKCPLPKCRSTGLVVLAWRVTQPDHHLGRIKDQGAQNINQQRKAQRWGTGAFWCFLHVVHGRGSTSLHIGSYRSFSVAPLYPLFAWLIQDPKSLATLPALKIACCLTEIVDSTQDKETALVKGGSCTFPHTKRTFCRSGSSSGSSCSNTSLFKFKDLNAHQAHKPALVMSSNSVAWGESQHLHPLKAKGDSISSRVSLVDVWHLHFFVTGNSDIF